MVIDLRSFKDPSNDAGATTKRTTLLESTANRIEALTGDASILEFPHASLDRLLLLLCIDDVEDKADQGAACQEIARDLSLTSVR